MNNNLQYKVNNMNNNLQYKVNNMNNILQYKVNNMNNNLQFEKIVHSFTLMHAPIHKYIEVLF